MKRLALLSAIIIPFLVIVGFIAKGRTSIKDPSITFYKTPLVCNAAPEIGCGSRSKPALLELEKNPAVKEAWLNRPGTVIAIVWKDKAQTNDVVSSCHNQHHQFFKGNYGLYFTIWDRLMGTLRPDYDDVFETLKKREH